MLSTLLWIAIGIFNLPVWTLEHARAPSVCQPFKYEAIGLGPPPDTFVLSIGYCEDVTTSILVLNGRYQGSSSFVRIGTQITFQPNPLPNDFTFSAP